MEKYNLKHVGIDDVVKDIKERVESMEITLNNKEELANMRRDLHENSSKVNDLESLLTQTRESKLNCSLIVISCISRRII